jgi:hypothetical protein
MESFTTKKFCFLQLHNQARQRMVDQDKTSHDVIQARVRQQEEPGEEWSFGVWSIDQQAQVSGRLSKAR